MTRAIVTGVTMIGAALAATPLAAQNAPPPLAPPAMVAPPVSTPPAEDPLASFVIARGEVESPKGRMPVQLLVKGDDAAVRGVVPGEMRWRYLPIGDPDTALRLLADRRLAFLWEPLLAWTGPDLGLLRQRTIDKAERAYAMASPNAPTNSADSTVRPPTRALLQFANVLYRAGYSDRALKLVEDERAKRTLKANWDQMEWVILTIREGNLLIGLGRYDEAIRLLAEARERIGRENVFGVNIDVNRAAGLANVGRYAEALAVITEARAQFDGGKERGKRGAEKLDGSDRQFEWIRGCALKGLGRADEARPAFATVLNAPEPADPFFKTENNDQLRFRVYFCTRDSAALATYLKSDIDTSLIAPGSFLLLQPAWRTTNDPGKLYDAVRADPGLRIAAARWMRELPPALLPALNYWR
ncbi:MAG: tetratricopeptide repeat protein [Sphingomonas sp.]|uniref:tetratricopeptide repeat protein n=1 Tax=Sphingomonas sp. TaxID=28214 RepID=UPI0011F8ED7B|nr:tetratricopeptide repeat protein [Sphingomonas sp.]THD34816.1 MAG: tetratricopeptide repeat protein [Sphingomonas sp.]